MKRYVKILLDIVMLALFLYLMYYHPGMGLRLHAILGIALCVLFVLHHFLNYKWYAVLFKGQYRFRRIIMTASDFLLLFAMLAIMVSSFMISGLAFPISFLPMAFYWRDIHVMSTTWGFLQSGLWNDMRMIPQSLPPLPASLFYAEYIGIIGGMCVAVHFLTKILL